MELLPFVDILKVFNNPINEEQAWAVCYQCVNFLFRNQKQEYYQFVYEYGIHSIWLSRQGDVLLRKMPPDVNECGKGSPQNQHSLHGSTSSSTDICKPKRHLIATEMDAVQALGTAIFEALDYGIDPTEERQLSQELESLIITMTNADNSMDCDPDAQNADDEGIEKDADIEHRCTVLDVIRMCGHHLSSKQDAQHHYKAVCRALATEAGELFTFLDKIATCKEKLSEAKDEDARRLEELRRADWACLWVQVMRSLRQGVCLKKVEHVSLPPLEYELTPFEMLLEDIRSRRYTLHKIMVNGEIPHKVKDNAHAVILDFIRSRPPLKKVNERKLKPKPPPEPDLHERLLKEIRARPKLRPVRSGRLVVDTSGARLAGDDEPELPRPAKRVIKADLNLLLNNSFEESSDDDDHSSGSSQMSSPVSAAHSKMSTPLSSWQRPASKDAFLQDSSSHRPTKLQRRHTIMVCDSSMDRKVAPQELPPLEEEEEPSPVRESHHFSNDSISRQAHSLAVLSRTSFSDNDLPNQVTLRYPQGHPRRYSLEHRRSLTSMNTGLCAIPEMEDGQSGTDSPTKTSSAMLRSWSHEQAPPPNPSPPCKGRARAALGMSLAGMKSVGGPYHPGAHRLHAGEPSTVTFHNTSTRHTSSEMTADTVQTLATHCAQHMSVSSSKHVHLPSTTSLPSSISISTYSSSQIPILDPTASSQSPGYRRKLVMPQGSVGQTKTSCDNSQQHEHYNDRWRQPIVRQGKLYSQQRQDTTPDDDLDCIDSSSDHQKTQMSTEEARSRRLSLDSRVGLYKERHEQLSGSAEFDETHKPSRRLSLGTQRNIRGVDVTHRRVRTIEEEERLSRLKMLHGESLTPRTRRVGRDMNNQQNAFTTEPAKLVSQQYSQYNKGASLPDLSNEKMDIFQQTSASEEARFARWRQLEEAGGFTVPLEEDLKKLSPVEKEYVKDILTARLQSSAPVNSAESGSSIAPGVLPLPKRWQNPVECLSLTLEEVTHIRSVLTKAELESLISHPDLYQQVSKNKLCFTCKTTRFSLFGEWGTKCKFCKRTVCSKCLRKMNVPDDQFKHIPVYTLSPSPLTPEMQEVVYTLTKASSIASGQLSRSSNISGSNTDLSEQSQLPDQRPQLAESVPSLSDDAKVMKGFFTRSKPLQRSQSLLVPGHKSAPGIPRTTKGPAMAICCDCKGMVKEIIQATQASLAVLSSPGSSAALPTSNIHPTSTLGNLTISSG